MNDQGGFNPKQNKSLFTYIAEDYPLVASKTKALQKDAEGKVILKERQGEVLDTTLNGFCFESEEAIAPGTEIKANMIRLGDRMYLECEATVICCNKTDEEQASHYEICVKQHRRGIKPLIDLTKKGFGSVKVF